MRDRYEDLPIEIIGYYPLELLPVSLITPTGMQYVRGDYNLHPGTIEKLKTSERSLLEKAEYKEYLQLILLDYTLKNKTFEESFSGHNSIGRAHLSLLIKEKPEQTYAELVAAFSMDRRIPFIAGLMIIEDYKAKHNGIEYIDYSGKNLDCRIWHPQKSNVKPPISYRRILENYQKDSAAMESLFILATLKDYCFNKNLTMEVLGINQYIFYSRLKKLKVIDDYHVINKQKAELILNKAIKSVTGDGLMNIDRHLYGNPERVAPPAKQKSYDTKIYTDISTEAVLSSLSNNRFNKMAAAAELNIPYPVFQQRLSIISDKKQFLSDDLLDAPFYKAEEEIPIYDPMQKIEADDIEEIDDIFSDTSS